MTNGTVIEIPGRYHAIDSNGIVTGADEIFDDDLGKKQSQINAERLSNIIPISYADIKALRDNSHLIPGQQYRITDYECVTVQAETKSAFHPFDIIVIADSINTLNESARAIAHAGDTYFQNCKLEAWELKYCLDNDATRFTWALADNVSAIRVDGRDYPRYTAGDTVVDDTTYYAWGWANNDIIYTASETPAVDDTVYLSTEEGSETTAVAAISIGKGIIYWMKDEYYNEAPWDFKNIQFKAYGTSTGHSGFKNKPCVFSTLYKFIPYGTEITINKGADSYWIYTFGTSTNTADVTVTNNFKGGHNKIDISYMPINNTGNGSFPRKLSFISILNSRGNFSDICITGYSYNIIVYGNQSIHIKDSNNITITGGTQNGVRLDRCTSIYLYTNNADIVMSNVNFYYGINQQRNIEIKHSNDITSTVFRYNSIIEDCNEIFIQHAEYTVIKRCFGCKLLKGNINGVSLINCNFVELTSNQTTSTSNKLQNIEIKGIQGTPQAPKVISHDTLNDDFITTYQPKNSQTISV